MRRLAPLLLAPILTAAVLLPAAGPALAQSPLESLFPGLFYQGPKAPPPATSSPPVQVPAQPAPVQPAPTQPAPVRTTPAPTPLAGAAGEGSAPPYDTDLMRLSEILGALHYLRPLCGAKDEGQKWRDEMQALLEAEQPSEARRLKIVASFNRGYSSFAEVYRTCTPSAELAVRRQLEESARLAHDIVVRFGGN